MNGIHRWRRKISNIAKFTKDKSVSTLLMPIVVHFHTVFGILQKTQKNKAKGITLETSHITSASDGNIHIHKKTYHSSEKLHTSWLY